MAENEESDTEYDFQSDLYDKETFNSLENGEEEEKCPEGYKCVLALLVKCNLEQLLPTFVKDEVDDDYVVQLNIDDEIEWGSMCKLFTTIGSQGKFRRALKNFQEVNKPALFTEKPKKKEVPTHYNFFNHCLNLQKALADSKDFQKCLEEVGENSALSPKLRRYLIEAIVEYTTSKFIWVEQAEFKVLFDRIKEVFPKESLDLYFVPGTSTTCPGGALFNAYRYAHARLQKETGISRRKRTKKTLAEVRPEHKSTLTKKENDNLRRELIGREEPWEAIREDWVKTFAYRRNEIEKNGCASVIPRWPKLKKKRGYELIELDFKQLFPGNYRRFFQEWPSWAEKILNAAFQKAKKNKKKLEYSRRFEINAESPSFDLRVLEALFFFLGKKNDPKIMEQFVQYINYGDNVMEKVRKIADAYTNNFHPLILVATTGENEIPFRYYVSVFDMIYTFESCSSAIDNLFKSFFALNVGYPDKIIPIYTFIQQFLYGIYLKGDGKYNSVITLIESLDCTRLASENPFIN
ncbi:hypothetical protein ACFFRR_009309 [Megaselia abdita]